MVEAGLPRIAEPPSLRVPDPQPGRSRPSDSISSRVPYPNFGVIPYVTDHNNGHYNAASVKVTHRYSDGLNLNTCYTCSKSMDNASGTRNQGFDTLFPQDNRCMHCDSALSAFDARHRWVMGGVYELPIGGARASTSTTACATAFGGWQVSTNITIPSGVPQTLSAGKVQSGPTAWGPIVRTSRAWATATVKTPRRAVVRPCFLCRGACGNARQRRAEFAGHTASAADRRCAGEAFRAA